MGLASDKAIVAGGVLVAIGTGFAAVVASATPKSHDVAAQPLFWLSVAVGLVGVLVVAVAGSRSILERSQSWWRHWRYVPEEHLAQLKKVSAQVAADLEHERQVEDTDEIASFRSHFPALAESLNRWNTAVRDYRQKVNDFDAAVEAAADLAGVQPPIFARAPLVGSIRAALLSRSVNGELGDSNFPFTWFGTSEKLLWGGFSAPLVQLDEADQAAIDTCALRITALFWHLSGQPETAALSDRTWVEQRGALVSALRDVEQSTSQRRARHCVMCHPRRRMGS